MSSFWLVPPALLVLAAAVAAATTSRLRREVRAGAADTEALQALGAEAATIRAGALAAAARAAHLADVAAAPGPAPGDR